MIGTGMRRKIALWTTIALMSLSIGMAGCRNPWATPTPVPAPAATPIPAYNIPLVIPALNPGAGLRDASGSVVPYDPGGRIEIRPSGQGQLRLSIPVAFSKGAPATGFKDEVSGVILTSDTLVVPMKDSAGKATVYLVAAVKALMGTGTGTEGSIEKLELDISEVGAILDGRDSDIDPVSFKHRFELRSFPDGAAVKIGFARKPAPSEEQAFLAAASGKQRIIKNIAFVVGVTKMNLSDSKDIGPGEVSMSVGGNWANAWGFPNIAIVTVSDDGTAEVIATRLAKQTNLGEAVFTAVTRKGASTFGLVALDSQAPTPMPPVYTLKLVNNTPEFGTVEVQPRSDSGAYPNGARVVLRALPKAGHKFDYWAGDLQGNSDQSGVVMDGDKTVIATFRVRQFEVNGVADPPNGGTVEFVPNLSSYDYGSKVTATAVKYPGYIFQFWSGDVQTKDNPVTFTVDRTKEVRANFASVRYSLSVATIPDGSGKASPNGGTFEPGATVTLTATPSPGYFFVSWSGDVVGTSNPTTLTMDQNKRVVANFARNKYSLTVLSEPSTSGSVTPGGGVFSEGEMVTLTAVPHGEYVFAGWGGDVSGTEARKTITITKNMKAVANFALRTYFLNVAISPPDAGTISPGEHWAYPSGSIALISAEPLHQYMFVSWTGDISSNSPFIDVKMDRDIYLVANFRYVPPP